MKLRVPWNRLPRPLVLAGGTALVLLVGLVDYATGPAVRLSLLFLVPVAAVAWALGRLAGVGMSVFAALVWLLVDLLARPGSPPSYWPLIWETGTIVGFFSAVALALAALAERQRREESLSGADALTGVANFRHFIDLLEDEIGRCRRYGRSFSIAVMDLDDFAAFNEARGAAAGDTLLVGVAEALRSGLRATDRLGRCGGDEFVVLLPETDVDAATRIIDRLRELFRKTMDAQHWSVSMSIGLVTFAEAPQNVREALRQADELMYAVKQSGKNAVRQAVVGHKRWPHIIR